MLNALMLLGLAGLAIPIAIHMIHRQRFKPELLGTVRFIRPDNVTNRASWIPKDLLQLFLRLLLLTIFILLMTRLLAPQDEVGPRAVVLVMDRSMSMQQTPDGSVSVIARRQAEAGKLLDTITEDDVVAVISAGEDLLHETPFLDQAEDQRKALAKAAPTELSGGGLISAIKRGAERLHNRSDVNRAIMVFTDLQRHGLADALTDPGQDVAEQLTQIRRILAEQKIDLVFIGTPDDAAPSIAEDVPEGVESTLAEESEPLVNLSIQSARFDPPRAYLGGNARVTATLINHTDQPQRTAVTFFEGQPSAGGSEAAGDRREVELGPREILDVDLVHRFQSPVDQACRVELPEDALLPDNAFHLPMRMKQGAKVLVVTRRAPTGEGLTARGEDLLVYAMNPGEAAGLSAGTHVSAKRLLPLKLSGETLPLYAQIVLYGIDSLPGDTIQSLSAYVERGGGLLLIPDAETSPVRFNETFAPLLGATRLGIRHTPDPIAGLGGSDLALDDDFLKPLTQGEWGKIEDVFVKVYHKLLAPGDADVVLRADNTDPLALRLQRGRGDVYLQLFSLDLADTSLPLSVPFVAMTQQLMASLGQSRAEPGLDVMRVGEVYDLAVPSFRGLSGEVELQGPQNLAIPLGGEDRDQVRVEGALLAGAYQVTHPTKKTGMRRWLTVNHPGNAESELDRVTVEELSDLFGPHVLIRPVARLDELFDRRHEALPFMVLLLAVMVFTEAVFGAWQSRRVGDES